MQFPKVIRRPAENAEKCYVYIEDYAYSYLNGLKRDQGGLPIRAALYGEAFSRENTAFYMIYGASCIVDEMERGRSQEEVREKFFPDHQLLGYVNLYGSRELEEAEDTCAVFYEKNEPMLNYLLDLQREPPKKASGKRYEMPPAEKLQKIFFLLLGGILLLMAAVSAVILGDYDGMYGFMKTTIRALQEIR